VTINKNRRTALAYLLLDLSSVVVFFNVVIDLRMLEPQVLLVPLLVPAFLFFVMIHLIDGYGSQSDLMSLDYACLHLIASAFAALTMLFFAFILVSSGLELRSSRSAIVVAYAVVGVVTLSYRRLIYLRQVSARGQRHLIFIGGAADYATFRSECERLKTTMPLTHVSSEDGFSALGGVMAAVEGGRMQVEAIVIRESVRDLPADVPMRLMSFYFAGIPTYTLEIFHQVYWRKIPLYRINPTWLFQEGFQIAREPVFERIKRASDILLAIVGLTLAAIPIALAAVAIKVEDGGRVFFRQRRIGRNRVGFELIKLRTMRESGGTGPLYTQLGDSRITRVGRLLRTARLDELPQLWNVLRGEMSLIGPRAEWDLLVDKYDKEIPCYHFRHLVKPGITGWAQVNYRYGAGVEDTLRKLEYDLYYIRSFSFMLDASIVLKTFHVMILQKGR
jgi:lipopolysaccharide/colanic/teichoic acid biosynthesis glycosyltransferase